MMAKSTDPTFSIRLPAELTERIDADAVARGIKRTAWFRLAAEGMLRSGERGQNPPADELRQVPRETPRIDTPWGPPMKAATKKAAPPPRQHQVGCSCLMCKEGK